MKADIPNLNDSFDFEQWKETDDVEFKLAQGKDGRGVLPNSIWETYSAMANSAGGCIFLGIKEIPGKGIDIRGVPDVDKVCKEFWNQINNQQKVNVNLLSSKDVSVLDYNERKIICIRVRRAARRDRPVYIDGNPMTGTFRRQNDGDYHCPADLIQRMMAEKTSDTLDAGIVEGFGLDDIDAASLSAYRQMFANRTPAHPFNEYPDKEFLQNLGAWREDRMTGETGLTTAGLLMFGKLRSILDAMPNYIVDYREYGREIGDSERWIDRVTTDFTWPGNIFSFCRIVLQRLYQTLKVPFRIQDGIRVDESPVHVAVREALVNTLIHADYREGRQILVVKRPDLFGFRNPGMLRIPREDAIRGGTMNSDCRNRTLQKMFQLIGYAEQAGSGFPKIYSGWNSQNWKKPEFREDLMRSETYLALRTTSLLPDDAVSKAGEVFGRRFETLPPLERLAVVTAFAEEEINHSRLAELCTEHPADISKALRNLVEAGIFESEGHGRGTFYRPRTITGEMGSSSAEKGLSEGGKGLSPTEKGPSEKGPSGGDEGPSSASKQTLPKAPALNKIRRECLTLLIDEEMSAAVIRGRLGRSNASKLRTSVITPLLKAGFIEQTKDKPHDSRQAYRITELGRKALQEAR